MSVPCPFAAATHRIGHHVRHRLDALRVDEGTWLPVEAKALVDDRTLAPLHHLGGDRLLPDMQQRPIDVAERGLARHLPTPPSGRRSLGWRPYLATVASAASTRRIVCDPVVEHVFRDRDDRHVAPTRQQESFSMRCASVRKLCPLPGTAASASIASCRNLAIAASA